MVPGSKRLAVVRVHNVRLAFLEACQAGPVAATLDAKAAGYPRAETLRPRDLSNEVHLFYGFGNTVDRTQLSLCLSDFSCGREEG